MFFGIRYSLIYISWSVKRDISGAGGHKRSVSLITQFVYSSLDISSYVTRVRAPKTESISSFSLFLRLYIFSFKFFVVVNFLCLFFFYFSQAWLFFPSSRKEKAKLFAVVSWPALKNVIKSSINASKSILSCSLL